MDKRTAKTDKSEKGLWGKIMEKLDKVLEQKAKKTSCCGNSPDKKKGSSCC